MGREATNWGGVASGFRPRREAGFRGAEATSDADLPAYRELDEALDLSDSAGQRIDEWRTGKNCRHATVGLLRQSIYSRMCADSPMRHVMGGQSASSTISHCCTVGQGSGGVSPPSSNSRTVLTP